MPRLSVAISVCALCCAAAATEAAAPAEKAWIEKSNTYTNKLLAVEFEHAPEKGSRQGLAKFDERISNPTLADELAERRELEAALASVNAAAAQEPDKKVQEDIRDPAQGLRPAVSQAGLRAAARGAVPQRQRDRIPGAARPAG